MVDGKLEDATTFLVVDIVLAPLPHYSAVLKTLITLGQI